MLFSRPIFSSTFGITGKGKKFHKKNKINDFSHTNLNAIICILKIPFYDGSFVQEARPLLPPSTRFREGFFRAGTLFSWFWEEVAVSPGYREQIPSLLILQWSVWRYVHSQVRILAGSFNRACVFLYLGFFLFFFSGDMRYFFDVFKNGFYEISSSLCS